MWDGRANFQEDNDRTGLPGWFWPTVFLLSGALLLASNSVMAGAIIPAAVSMQPALRTARWIRNNDPDSKRARACSRFLIATGCWNALATGLISLAVLVVATIVSGQPPTEAQGMVCIYGIAVATLATCFVGYSAIWTAWVARVRVWVHPKLQTMAKYDFSALRNLTLNPTPANYAFFVMAISLNLPVIAVSTGWLVYLAGSPAPDEEKAFANACGLASLAIGPVIAIGVLVVLSSRLLAGSLAECWSDAATGTEDT